LRLCASGANAIGLYFAFKTTAFLRRRFRYGATLGVRHARSPALAARQGASSAVGAPVAAARGDERLFMERALRAVENAGVLAGPLLARR